MHVTVQFFNKNTSGHELASNVVTEIGSVGFGYINSGSTSGVPRGEYTKSEGEGHGTSIHNVKHRFAKSNSGVSGRSVGGAWHSKSVITSGSLFRNKNSTITGEVTSNFVSCSESKDVRGEDNNNEVNSTVFTHSNIDLFTTSDLTERYRIGEDTSVSTGHDLTDSISSEGNVSTEIVVPESLTSIVRVPGGYGFEDKSTLRTSSEGFESDVRDRQEELRVGSSRSGESEVRSRGVDVNKRGSRGSSRSVGSMTFAVVRRDDGSSRVESLRVFPTSDLERDITWWAHNCVSKTSNASSISGSRNRDLDFDKRGGESESDTPRSGVTGEHTRGGDGTGVLEVNSTFFPMEPLATSHLDHIGHRESDGLTTVRDSSGRTSTESGGTGSGKGKTLVFRSGGSVVFAVVYRVSGTFTDPDINTCDERSSSGR